MEAGRSQIAHETKRWSALPATRLAVAALKPAHGRQCAPPSHAWLRLIEFLKSLPKAGRIILNPPGLSGGCPSERRVKDNAPYHFRRPLRLAILAVALLGGILPVRADTILLKGGERVIGQLLAEETDKVRFESQTFGVIEIPRDRIERIERDTPPPPPETSASVAPAPAAPATDTILPAPPPAAPEVPAPLPEPAPAIVNPTEPVIADKPVSPPPILPSVVAPAPAPVVAPEVATAAVAPVFYPWSGLKTEQDTFDWIQLKSGEWLKGQIKSMQDEKLDFDSEEMDEHEFKWEDVTIVRSPRLNSLRFEQAGTANGSLLITADSVKVISQAGTQTYTRADLLAITATGERERDKWSTKVSLGLSLHTGNAEEASYNVHAALERRTPATRLSLDYLGNFNRINGVVSQENQRVTTRFDYFLSRKLYIRFPDAEYYRDPLQNIDQRLTVGAAVGYDLFRTRRIEWDVSAGPAYQSTQFSSVEAGQESKQESFTVVLSTHFDVQVTKKIDWIFDYRGQLAPKDTGGTTHHANSTLEFEIHKRLKLDISLIWDRVTSPKTESGGSTPTPDDLRLITSLGIDF